MEQEETVPTSPPPEDVKGLSFRGLIEVFYQPSAFFAQLKENPKVLVVYLILAIMTFVFWWSIKDLFVAVLSQMPEFQERLQGQDLPPSAMRLIGIWQAVQNSVLVALGPLLAALLAWFWGNFVFAGRARFKQLVSVMLYGEIIYAVGNLVTLPMILIRESIFVSMSLGALAPEKSFTSPLFMALSKLDVFLIWEIIAVGVGLSVVYNFSRNKGYLLSVLSMGMLSILSVLWTIVSGLIF